MMSEDPEPSIITNLGPAEAHHHHHLEPPSFLYVWFGPASDFKPLPVPRKKNAWMRGKHRVT
jgi:hypothetical protein